MKVPLKKHELALQLDNKVPPGLETEHDHKLNKGTQVSDHSQVRADFQAHPHTPNLFYPCPLEFWSPSNQFCVFISMLNFKPHLKKKKSTS